MDFGSEKIEDCLVAPSLEGYESPYFTYYFTMLVPLVGEVWAKLPQDSELETQTPPDPLIFWHFSCISGCPAGPGRASP